MLIPSLWYLRHSSSELVGILVMRVDDILLSGSGGLYQASIASLKAKVKFGHWNEIMFFFFGEAFSRMRTRSST